MAERKKLQERALEAMVYLPVGTAMAAKEEIPRLTAKGRAYVTTQLTMAKTVGNFAVIFGGREAEKQLLRGVRRLGVLWGDRPVGSPSGPEASSAAGPAAPKPSAAPATPGSALESTGAGLAGHGGKRNGSTHAPTGIAGYDSLSASQVVQRLAGLPRDELIEVRSYEAATRGRATILSKTAQLLGTGQE